MGKKSVHSMILDLFVGIKTLFLLHQGKNPGIIPDVAKLLYCRVGIAHQKTNSDRSIKIDQDTH